MPDFFYVGTVATLKGEFVNTAGALTDPTTVTLTITAPDGTVTVVNTAGLTHVGTGVYSYNLSLTLPGVVQFEFDGTGAVPADAVGYLTAIAVGAAQLRNGPCADWCSIDDVRFIGAYASATTLPDPAILRMIPVASALLFERTARRFPGICPTTVRPCRRSTVMDVPFPSSWSWTGSWQDQWGMCGCHQHDVRSCGCSWLSELTLGVSPIRQISEVRIDGAVLASSAYRVDDHRWLVRIDGQGWPCCQDLTKNPATDANTFQVKALYGVAPPVDGVLAAAVLAGELALAASSQSCRLPKRIATLTRQGVQQTIFDPAVLLKDRLWGIPEIDAFTMTHNPHGLQRRASIISPDVTAPVRRAGW